MLVAELNVRVRDFCKKLRATSLTVPVTMWPEDHFQLSGERGGLACPQLARGVGAACTRTSDPSRRPVILYLPLLGVREAA